MPTHLRGQVLSGARSALSRQPGVTPSILNPIEGEPNPLYLSVTEISPCAPTTWWGGPPPPPCRLAVVHPVGDHEVQQRPDDGHHDGAPERRPEPADGEREPEPLCEPADEHEQQRV